MSLRVVIACGGTGGHLFPGIAVAEGLQNRGHECLVLISRKEIDALASEGYDHLKFEKVDAIGMPKLISPKVIPFAFKFWKTLRTCRGIVRAFEADAVLGMGGFTSLPPVWAGHKQGAKTFIHDSNAIPGKSNKLTARFADVVLLGVEECARHFPDRATEVVGTPVRPSLLREVGEDEALEAFGFEKSGKRTLFVMGGSQGARGINRGVCAALPVMKEAVSGELRVVHLSGKEDAEETRAAYEAAGIEHFVAAFSQKIECAYKLADLVVARSGASSMTELAVFGLPSVLVPYPYAAEDHQTRNAEVFTSRDAAVMVKESDIVPESFGKTIADLLNDPEALERLSSSVSALAVRDAAGNIAAFIEEQCH